MEPQVGDGQSLNDIQNYLANFNKEISAGGQTYILAASGDNVAQAAGQGAFVVAHTGEQLYEGDLLPEVGDEGMTVPKAEQITEGGDTKLKIEGAQLDEGLLGDAGGENALFNPIHITPSQGHTSTTEPLFTVQAPADGGQTSTVNAAAGSQLISVEPGMASALQSQLVSIQPSDGSGTPQMVAVSPGQQLVTMQPPQQPPAQTEGEEAEEEEPEEDEDEEGQEGDGNYQTVTIVPSEVNQGGEVSYVLIVSQNDQEQKVNQDGNIDMSVYDFKEEAKGAQEPAADDGTPKAAKVTPKKQISMLSAQLMCNYCNYTSPKRYLLTRHMKTHSEERPHKCHICDRGFKTVASLQNHINTHTGVRPHKCKECDAAFTTSGELVRHVRYRHTYEKPHKCPECDYASVELSKLKRHMRSHTGERPYQCPHCSYASPDTYKLKRHLRIHTGEKPYECEICHTRFTQSNSLKAHKLIHSGNKPIYQCELCPTTCGRKTDLKIHVQKLHTSERPLMCKKCGKSFPDRYTWKIHVKTHEGEKCFKCELCPYAALSQRHLESHLLTHTGEKPFECDECDQTFRQKQLLKRHRNLYHTPDYVPPPPKEKIHPCTECGKAFAHKGNLLRHRAGHDPDNQEYQEALENYRLERGDDYEEEEEEEEEEDEDEEEPGVQHLGDAEQQQVLVTQAVIGDGQNYQAEATGQIHMANINGQQVQLQLVNLNDENNTQVYIQIDSSQQLQTLMAGGAGVTVQEGGEAQEEPMEEGVMPIEADTPPGNPEVRVLEPVKQEEMKQETPETPVRRSRVRSGAQAATVAGLHSDADEGVDDTQVEELEGYLEQEIITDVSDHSTGQMKRPLEESVTPSKRPRRQSPRRLQVDEDDAEEERREQQKKKDIETCFGFEEI